MEKKSKKQPPSIPNLTCIDDDLFIVRTQRGFKKIQKFYKDPGIEFHFEEYPLKYPALVKVEYEYRGYHRRYTKVLYMKKYMEVLLKIVDTIKLHLTN